MIIIFANSQLNLVRFTFRVPFGKTWAFICQLTLKGSCLNKDFTQNIDLSRLDSLRV